MLKKRAALLQAAGTGSHQSCDDAVNSGIPAENTRASDQVDSSGGFSPSMAFRSVWAPQRKIAMLLKQSVRCESCANAVARSFAQKPLYVRMAYTRSVLASAGIQNASFHLLQHTTASWLLMNGVSLYTMGKILGHKTPGMTQRYARLSPDCTVGAVNKLDTFFAVLCLGHPRSLTV